MAATVYKREELIPVLINVLDICTSFYSSIAFKFAVKDYYPDLKGIVCTDKPDDLSMELLYKLLPDNELYQLMLSSIATMQGAGITIVNLYGLDHDALDESKRAYL